jgi:hypothetical protein
MTTKLFDGVFPRRADGFKLFAGGVKSQSPTASMAAGTNFEKYRTGEP